MKQHPETGAPANAKKLEQHASEAEQQVVRTRTEIQDLLADLPKHDGSDEKQKKIRESIDSLYNRLGKEYDLWLDLSKQVVAYDKAVSETRRDGEKISRSDVDRLLTNAWRFQRIGREAFIISISQDAMHCTDEQDFYAKFSESIRLCEIESLKLGIENDKFPAWVLDCYASSL